MASALQNYIAEKIQEVNPDMNLYPGSAMYDLLVTSTSYVVEDFYSKVQNLESQIDFANLSNLADSDIDSIASRFLVPRATGQKATGTLIMYFSVPTATYIPAGTEFTSNSGQIFETINDINVTDIEMRQNLDPTLGRYFIDNIGIQATDTGEEFNALAGTITSTNTFFNNLVNITNQRAILNGRTAQTNAEVIESMEASIADSIYLSPKSFNNLKSSYPELVEVSVVGVGDKEMTRDIINPLDAQFAASNFKNINYLGKVKDSNFFPSIESQAYTLTLNNDLTNIEVSNTFNNEFSQAQYNGLYYKDTVGLDNTAETSSALYESSINNAASSDFGLVEDSWYSGEIGDEMTINVMQTAFTVVDLGIGESDYWFKIGAEGV